MWFIISQITDNLYNFLIYINVFFSNHDIICNIINIKKALFQNYFKSKIILNMLKTDAARVDVFLSGCGCSK